MNRTINGKPLESIIQELQADFPPEAIEKRDYDGIYYIGVDAYRERLNTVIGIAHYNELYDEVEVVKAQDSYATKTKCRLEILDDEFNIVIVKESAGGSNIAFPKVDGPDKDKDGKPIKVPGTTTNSLPNDFDSACQDAFKRICKKQLLMGKRQLDNAKAGTPYCLTITKALHEYNGHIFGEGKMENGKVYKIAIFKNQAETFKKVYGMPGTGQNVTFYGKEGKDNKQNDQIVFEKACNSSTSPAKTSDTTSDAGDKHCNNASQQAQSQSDKSKVSDNQDTQQKQTDPSAAQPIELPQKERINISVDTELVNTVNSRQNYCLQGHTKSGERINVLFYKEDYQKDKNWNNFKQFLQNKPQGKEITFEGIRIKDNRYRCLMIVA